MRDASKPGNSSAKKSRLGRGLGSLLGGTPDLGSDDPIIHEVAQKPVQKLDQKAAPAPVAQPAKATAKTSGVAAKEALKTVANEKANEKTSQKASQVTTQGSLATPAMTTHVTSQKSVDSQPVATQKSVDAKQMTSQKSVTTQNPVALNTHVDSQMTTQSAAAKPLTTQPSAVVTSQTSGGTGVTTHTVPTSVKDAAKTVSVQTNPQTSPQLSTVAATPVPQKASEPKVEVKAEVKSEAKSESKIDEQAQIWKIPIDRIVANTQQPRQTFSADALRDLTASIKEHGILQPITARRLGERQFEIIAGERRFRAAQAAGLHEVPVILKAVTEQVSLELAIVENMQREDLNPMEEAEAIEHLMTTYKLTQALVGEKLGKDRSSVANSLRLLNLPKDVRELVRTTELSAGHAKVLLGAENPETMRALAKQVLLNGLSVRATERLVVKAKEEARARANGETSTESKVPDRVIAALTNELQKLVGTRVAIDYAGGKGKMTVHFYDDAQLNSIVEKLRKSWAK